MIFTILTFMRTLGALFLGEGGCPGGGRWEHLDVPSLVDEPFLQSPESILLVGSACSTNLYRIDKETSRKRWLWAY